MTIQKKIDRLNSILDLVEEADDHLQHIETTITHELEQALRYHPVLLREILPSAEKVLGDCEHECKCPICLATKAIRDEFGSCPPDDYYRLEDRCTQAFRRLGKAVDQAKEMVSRERKKG